MEGNAYKQKTPARVLGKYAISPLRFKFRISRIEQSTPLMPALTGSALCGRLTPECLPSGRKHLTEGGPRVARRRSGNFALTEPAPASIPPLECMAWPLHGPPLHDPMR